MSELIYTGNPYRHQKLLIEESWAKPVYGLFWEMGIGKSYAAIMTMLNLYLAGKLDTVLYVAKKGELSNFSFYEIPKYWPDHVTLKLGMYHGYATSKHVKQVKEILAPFEGLRLYSINIEALRSQTPRAIAEKFIRSSKKTMIIVDESTCLKDPRSVQTKVMMHLGNYAAYKRIMTGTVIPHGPVDIWSQAKWLGLDRTMPEYQSITSFKTDFLEQEMQFMGQRRYMAVVGPKNLDRLQNIMKRFGSVLTKEDCLDLPPKIYKDHLVKLTDEQINLYQQMVDFSIADLGDNEYIEGINALSVASKLHQIVCGQVRMPDGTYRLIGNNRYQAVAEICEEVLENQPKIIVWSHYRAATMGLITYLQDKKFRVIPMPAGMSIEERASRIEEFKTDPKAQVFLANPASSGFGITLTEAHTAIYASNSDNFEHRLQSEDRIHRIGQDTACLYIDLRSPGTVEDRIYSRNTLKAETRTAVMGRNDFIRMIELLDPAENF